MSIMRYLLIGAVLCTCAGSMPSLEDHHKLLLLSIDGVRWDQTDDMKGFRYIQENGVRAEYMIPAFPSHTSPCHMSIATGLHTESHGVVHNGYYDLKNNRTGQTGFHGALFISEWFDNGQEPIWITASSQGLKSGGYLYPGSNCTYKGRVPTRSILDAYPTIPTENDWRKRIDDVISWFNDDDFDFIALYLEGLDEISHEFGPNSKEVYHEKQVVDRFLQYMFKQVKLAGLEDDLNIIIVSDHGQLDVEVSYVDEKGINLTRYIDPNWITFVFSYGPLGLIEPVPEFKTRVYETLKSAHSHMDVYYKEDIPERYHYKNHERVPSIVVVAHPGYQMYDEHPGFEALGGDHGYDNRLEQMRAIYYSVGPSFKKGVRITEFESINVYPLMCYLLGLDPATNNGTLDILYSILKKDEEERKFDMKKTLTILAFTCFVLYTLL
ncbi:ectonucleotide pyrophosphatase/phosphodiesterase family member 7-like [Styela clava]